MSAHQFKVCCYTYHVTNPKLKTLYQYIRLWVQFSCQRYSLLGKLGDWISQGCSSQITSKAPSAVGIIIYLLLVVAVVVVVVVVLLSGKEIKKLFIYSHLSDIIGCHCDIVSAHQQCFLFRTNAQRNCLLIHMHNQDTMSRLSKQAHFFHTNSSAPATATYCMLLFTHLNCTTKSVGSIGVCTLYNIYGHYKDFRNVRKVFRKAL